MTPTEAKTLKPGDRVKHGEQHAIVERVGSNGVTIGVAGTGHKLGHYVTKRVSAASLSRP